MAATRLGHVLALVVDHLVGAGLERMPRLSGELTVAMTRAAPSSFDIWMA
jgi:hypothetical protein